MMKLLRLGSLLMFSATLLASPGFAADPPAMTAKPLTPAEQQMKKNIEDKIKDQIDEITPLPFGGMYEIRFGPKVVYSDSKGEFLFMGDLIDLKSRTNLTAQRTDALLEASLPKMKFADLPFNAAIKLVKGNGKRQVAVFEDPNCVFCKRLEHSFEAINDVTIYVFLYPVLGDDSVAKAKGIWCAKDPAKTWTAWMDNGTAIGAAASCSTASIDDNLALGNKLQVTGTPTMFFQNGKRVPGAIAIEDIDKYLSAS